MPALSRSQTVGITAVLVLVTGVVLVGVLRTGATSSAPGITLKDAFPQAPAAPPPVRPTDPVANPPQTSSPSLPTTTASDPTTPSELGSPISVPASNNTTNAAISPTPPSSPPAAPPPIAVDVAGAVRKPGLYYLPANARNNDAIKAAGGATDQANLTAINLASRLADGKQLYVPTRKERPQNGATDTGTDTPEAASAAATGTPAQTESGASVVGASSSHIAHAVSKAVAKKGGKSGSGKFHVPGEGTVNLNAATAEQLQRLPGVGPAMADRLIAFRKENHGFQTIEDLMQVSGIGPKKFEKMAPFCRVR